MLRRHRFVSQVRLLGVGLFFGGVALASALLGGAGAAPGRAQEPSLRLVEQVAGRARGYATLDGRAFAALGARVVELDARAAQMGQTGPSVRASARLSGLVMDLVAVEDLLLALAEQGVVVALDPDGLGRAPALATVSVPEGTARLRRAGDLVLAYGARGGGCVLIDVSDPREPATLATITIDASQDLRVADAVRHGDTLVVAGAQEQEIVVQLYDIADPARPRLQGQWQPEGSALGGTVQLAIAEGLLLVTDRNSSLRSLRWTPGGELAELGALELPGPVEAVALRDAETAILISARPGLYAETGGSAYLVDLADPAAPALLLEQTAAWEYPHALVMTEDGAHAIDESSGIHRIEVADGETGPVLRTTLQTAAPGFLHDLERAPAGMLYAADALGGVWATSLAEGEAPAEPRLVAGGRGTDAIALDGQTLWRIDRERELVALDLRAEPPAELQRADLREELGRLDDVLTLGGRLYVATRLSSRGDGARKRVAQLAFTEDGRWELVGSLDLPATSSTRSRLTPMGDGRFLLHDERSLHLLAIGEDGSLVALGHLPFADHFRDAAVVSEALVVGALGRSLVLVDLADPAAPRIQDSLPLGGTALAVAVDGVTAYASVAVDAPHVDPGAQRLLPIDLSDLGAPRIRQHLRFAGIAGRPLPLGHAVAVPAGPGGLVVFAGERGPAPVYLPHALARESRAR